MIQAMVVKAVVKLVAKQFKLDKILDRISFLIDSWIKYNSKNY